MELPETTFQQKKRRLCCSLAQQQHSERTIFTMNWGKSDREIWLGGKGIRFLQDLGVTAGEVVVDFGCNAGNYTIPAAELIGSAGRIYAIEQDAPALKQLKEWARSHNLKNIVYLNTSQIKEIDLKPHSIDLVLAYDVLHYFGKAERIKIYIRFYNWLKPDGMLSVFPKHNKQDFPMWHLAELDYEDIIGEIESTGFRLIEKTEQELIHDDYLENGVILNFTVSKLNAVGS
ncbi:hypothetical protein B1H10_02135 [candidate division KSB1 bacterium 4484_188]|nr:MAG: hypothetical protein B1H10_02135 [candidate division KSB1 bacterium 4484_188]